MFQLSTFKTEREEEKRGAGSGSAEHDGQAACDKRRQREEVFSCWAGDGDDGAQEAASRLTRDVAGEGKLEKGGVDRDTDKQCRC